MDWLCLFLTFVWVRSQRLRVGGASAPAPVSLAHVTLFSCPSYICIAGVCAIVRPHHSSFPYSGIGGYLHPSQSLDSVNYLVATVMEERASESLVLAVCLGIELECIPPPLPSVRTLSDSSPCRLVSERKCSPHCSACKVLGLAWCLG